MCRAGQGQAGGGISLKCKSPAELVVSSTGVLAGVSQRDPAPPLTLSGETLGHNTYDNNKKVF